MQKFQVTFLWKRAEVRPKLELGRLSSCVWVVELQGEGTGRRD